MINRISIVSRLVTVLYPAGVPVAHVPLLPRIMALLDVAAGSVAEGREVSVPLALMQGARCPYEPTDVSELSDEPVPFVPVGPTPSANSAAERPKAIYTNRAKARWDEKRGPARAELARARKGTDWDAEQRLGKIADTVLARELGVSSRAVCQARGKRGIPPAAPPGVRAYSPVLAVEAVPAPVVAKSATTAEVAPVDAPPAKAKTPPAPTPEDVEAFVRAGKATRITSRYVEPDSIPANPRGARS